MSIRRQIFTTLSVGILLLAIVSSVATAWLTTAQTRDLLLTQGRQITGNLAEQSVLGLLYGSADTAQSAVQAARDFPDVLRVAILDDQWRSLVDVGHVLDYALPRPTNGQAMEGAEMILEDADTWHFIAPVYSRAEAGDMSTLYADDRPQRSLLGHVYIGIGKGTLTNAQLKVFINNIGIALTVALLLLAVLRHILSRLTRPLLALAGVMENAKSGGKGAYAELAGPKEVHTIARVYNGLMETLEERDRRLRQHNDILESEVSLRTHELECARDVAVEANRHKSEFLANVTHELRTPLQAIMGYTDMAIEGLLDEGLDELADDLQRVQTSARHLLKLINEVLDLAKIEAGRMDLMLEEVSLQALMAEAVDTVRPLMEKNGNDLRTHITGTGDTLLIDYSRLLQILLNLMSNAAKFTHLGQVEVHVEHTPYRLRLKIMDTGIGMDPRQQELVFEQFRQADGSSTRHFEGTGLGLSITRQLCQLMGGDVSVESALGKGSVFSVVIPLPIKTSHEAASVEDSEKLQAGDLAKG